MFLAEHQGTPLSIDASPSVLLSAMFQRTQRLRAGALTFCLPWYDPYRFYNEVCMLDQLSGGRLELGVGRGVSPIESRIFGLYEHRGVQGTLPRDPGDLLRRLQFAAAQLPGQALRVPRRRAVQQAGAAPLPAALVPELEPRVDRVHRAPRLPHRASSRKTADSKALFDQYRETWEKHKGDLGRHNGHVAEPFLAKTQHIVIAETYVEAERIGLQAYETWKGHMHHLTRSYGRPEAVKLEPYSDESPQRLIVGPPDTVLEKLQEVIDGHRHELPAVHLLLRQPAAAGRACARWRCSPRK